MLTDAQIQEGSEAIAQYLGYNISTDVWHIPAKLNSIKNMPDVIHSIESKFHSSWSWQISVWSKLCREADKNIYGRGDNLELALIDFEDKYSSAIRLNNSQQGFTVLLELLTWYKNNKV